MNNKYFWGITIVIAGIVGSLFGYHGVSQNLGAINTTGVNDYYSITTSASSTVTTSSALITSTSTTRQYLRISNDGANTVYLGLGVAAAVGKGIYIPATGSYEMNPLNLFKGTIYAISVTGNSNVTITEK